MNKFAERLGEVLNKQEKSQNKLAKTLNTTQQTISSWTLGKQEPSFDTLLRICLELGVDPNFLLGYDELR